MIEIIPAIDIIDGCAVRLSQGDYASQKSYSSHPEELARRFEDLGFRRLHLVDLDGARSRHVVNLHVLEAIASMTSLTVDFGGGVKSNADVESAFNAGAAMVTVGSLAVTSPDRFAQWLQTYGPERLILGADARDGKVSINGWKEDSPQELLPFLQSYWEMGVTQVLCTDISRDGMLSGPAVGLYQSLLEANPACRLIASGGVGSIDDLWALNEAGVPAVVVGKAIYEGRIDLTAVSKAFNS